MRFAETLEKQRRVFGRYHHGTIVTSGNLAVSLSGQGKCAEVMEIGREVLVQKARLLGAEHDETMIPASNLVSWL